MVKPGWSRSSQRHCCPAPHKVFGTGSNTRDYVFVGDVVDAFVRASGSKGGGQPSTSAPASRPATAHLHTAVAAAVGAPTT